VEVDIHNSNAFFIAIMIGCPFLKFSNVLLMFFVFFVLF
jgi:hypothetical protein